MDKRLPRLAALCLLLAATPTVVPAAATAGGATFTVELAMNGLSFAFDGPTTPGGFPAYGASFVVQGYLYPEGTFATHGSTSGVLPDGSPEFPELVIGAWACRGWFVQDADAVSGVVVVTTQTFDLEPGTPGQTTLITDGVELAEFDLPFRRAITGGTGTHRRARGQMTQTKLDVNATGLFNMTFAAKT